jgi:hypothetical protein
MADQQLLIPTPAWISEFWIWSLNGFVGVETLALNPDQQLLIPTPARTNGAAHTSQAAAALHCPYARFCMSFGFRGWAVLGTPETPKNWKI